MKSKLTSIHFVWITILTLFFSSCQVEENAIIKDSTSSSYNVKNISGDEIASNLKIVEKLEKLTSKKNSSTSKNITFTDLGFTIETTNARYIEEGNYNSYTFSTVQKDTENIKNVLFSRNENGDYDAFLVEYEYNKLDLARFTEANKPGGFTLKPINLNLNSLTARSVALWVCTYTYGYVDTGELYGVGNEKYEWLVISRNCNVLYGMIEEEDHVNDNNSGTAGGGGGSNPSGGSGGGGIATSPKASLYDEDELYKIEMVKKQLNLQRLSDTGFLDRNGAVAFGLYDYLMASKSTEASRKFGKELFDIVRADQIVDINALNFVLDAEASNKYYTGLDDAYLLFLDQYMDEDMAAINAKDPDLIIYFGIHHIEKTLRLKKLNPQWSYLKCYWEASKEIVHITLDVFGTVPVVGELADITNGVLYVIEGDGVNATLSVASAVPFAGWAAVSTKYAIKFRQASNLATKVKLIWKKLPDGTIYFGGESHCRNQLRKILSLAVGNLQQAHHIIPLNLQRNPIVQKAAKSGQAFHLNDALNGIPLDKIVHNGSHANYDKIIFDKLEDFRIKVPNATPDQCYFEVNRIIQLIRTAIQKSPQTPINQLIF